MAKLSGLVGGLFCIDSCGPMDALRWAAALAFLLLAPAGCKSEETPPDPGPTDDITLTVIALSPTEVAFSWTDPSIGYAQRPVELHSEIFRDGVTLATTDDFAFTDTGALPSTRYCYHVSVIGIYQTILGGYLPYGWSSGETCVVTPGS